MKIKTSAATGVVLDWLVQAAQHDYPLDEVWGYRNHAFNPSTNWAQGGPIIERGMLTVKMVNRAPTWIAYSGWGYGSFEGTGPTPLIAAMRCYVASKLGDEVEVPEELK